MKLLILVIAIEFILCKESHRKNKDRVGMVIHLGDHDEDAMLLSNEF